MARSSVGLTALVLKHADNLQERLATSKGLVESHFYPEEAAGGSARRAVLLLHEDMQDLVQEIKALLGDTPGEGFSF